MDTTVFRFVRAIIGAGLLVGGLAFAATSAFAVSAPSSTQLNLTVPTTITLSGLNANYNATIPAGTSATIATGPITISTNANSGFLLNIKATTPAFQGTGATLANSADHLSYDACPVGGSCAGGDLNATAGTDLVTTHAAGVAVITVNHGITIPPTQAGDVYQQLVSYLASTN